jgi:hypothetical protein
MYNTQEQFVNKEIEVWGFDYISDLFDKGYEPLEILDERTGKLKWTWHLFIRPPRNSRPLARVSQ